MLWARDKLAADMGVADDGARWGGVALAHNVGSDAEVDRDRGGGARQRRRGLPRAGPDLLRRLRGRFRDLDGHVWEVAHNPGFGLTDDGAWSCRSA